ncbi:MAG: bifunctional DNA-formamidopyrimidine glycosylase/DNA-(apurinic or apyrimidinic site) lyase [Planctomycetales bacterium]|nr:bifunctional DNA-formamidopyrimidine glycosylase/DNA-(apurinic or apyrimidinic site) lyase [Planctomycetales bacterium]
MPELPEVETMRRGVAPAVGATIERFEKVRCPRKPIEISPPPPAFRRRVEGCRVTAAERAGKRVVLRLDSGDAIVFEPRMTGLLLLSDPPDPLYSRVRFTLSGRGRASQLVYWDRRGLGNVRLVTPAEFSDRYGPAALGPDALTMTSDEYRTRLGASRRAIKVALLDQEAVAGIGNLYAAEILHVAGIHPERECFRLTRAQWTALADAATAVLAEAIRYEGSTLSDGTYRNALNKAGGYQNEHRVYDKAGEPCPRCGRVIERIVQAQRSTFFCRGCQKRSGR